MNSKALVKRWVAVASNGFESIDPVDFFIVWWKSEGMPSELGGTDVDFGVQRQEARFELHKIPSIITR